MMLSGSGTVEGCCGAEEEVSDGTGFDSCESRQPMKNMKCYYNDEFTSNQKTGV